MPNTENNYVCFYKKFFFPKNITIKIGIFIQLRRVPRVSVSGKAFYRPSKKKENKMEKASRGDELANPLAEKLEAIERELWKFTLTIPDWSVRTRKSFFCFAVLCLVLSGMTSKLEGI